jgi:hypothetical protein
MVGVKAPIWDWNVFISVIAPIEPVSNLDGQHIFHVVTDSAIRVPVEKPSPGDEQGGAEVSSWPNDTTEVVFDALCESDCV